MKKVIAIDHGNKLMKGIKTVFPASFVESNYLPTIGGDHLRFGDKSYILTDESLPVLNNKTNCERYFILSLYAIGKELENDGEFVKRYLPHSTHAPHVNVELLVGLPLQHYETFRVDFAKYFKKRIDVISFELNGRVYAIQFDGVHVYPQAYAAAITAYDRLVDSRVLNIVDIGGFTIDCLQLNKFKPNMNLCTSLYRGVNTLFQSINEQIRSMGYRDISENIIEEIIKGDPAVLSEYSQKRIDVITSVTLAHVNRILAEIEQKNFDLEEDKTVFMGGGSILLKDYILQTGKVKKPIFIDDVNANAKGYRLLYDMQNGNGDNRRNHQADAGSDLDESVYGNAGGDSTNPINLDNSTPQEHPSHSVRHNLRHNQGT